MTGTQIPRDHDGRVLRPKPSQLLADVMEALGPDHLTTRTLMAALIERDQGAGVEPRAVSPVYGIHIPVLGDAPNVPYDMQENTLDVEAALKSSYASAAARDTAIPAPFEGQRCFRTDLNRDEVYSGTAWRGGYGIGTAASATRFGFSYFGGNLTTDAAGKSQAIDLSQSGAFTGNIIAAFGIKTGSTNTIQLSISAGAIGAVQFTVRDQTGATMNTQTFAVAIGYLAALAY